MPHRHAGASLAIYGALVAVSAAQACQLGNGKAVKWWAAFKPPDSRALHVLSWQGDDLLQSISTLEQPDDPVFATLQPLFDDPDAQYIVYNDEDPATGQEIAHKAHSKGVVVLHSDKTASWLQHSVPKFPHHNASIPHAQTVYGQHFMCLQVSASAAVVLLQGIKTINPQVHRCTIRDVPGICSSSKASTYAARSTLLEPEGALRHVESAFGITDSDARGAVSASDSAAIFVLTMGNSEFRVLRKRAHEHVPLWDAIVAPSLGCKTLFVESWLHGKGRMDNVCDAQQCVINADGMLLSEGSWDVNQDHSKWGVCCDKLTACFGDLNREESQIYRAGLAVCISDTEPMHFGKERAQSSIARGLSRWLREHVLIQPNTCTRQCSCTHSELSM